MQTDASCKRTGMMVAMFMFVVGHVPQYQNGCDMSCCTAQKTHDISQVAYLKGSGGLEVHVESISEPFDIKGGELIDFDVVFRDNIDTTTYSLHVGCGGCMPSDIMYTAPKVVEYQDALIEPYT